MIDGIPNRPLYFYQKDMIARDSLPIPVAGSSRFGLQDFTSNFCITFQPSAVLVHHQLLKLLVANINYKS